MFDQLLHFDTTILHVPYLQPVLALLVACLIFLPVLERLKVSPVLGYLLAGLLVGPSGLDVVKHSEALDELAELGVVFLLFIIGLNISWRHFATMRRLLLLVGAPQVIVTGAVIAFMAWQWEHGLSVTLLLGLSFALSSTAIVSQYLLDQDALKTPKGKLVMSVLLAQDLAVPVLLVMTNVFSQQNEDALFLMLTLTAVKAVAAVVIVLGVAKVILNPLHRTLHQHTKTPEITVALTFLAILVCATFTGMTGLSKELGAFLAGLMLAESGFQDKIHKDIRPFQGLLLGLFFITVGMNINVSDVLADFGWLITSVIGLFICKTTIICLLARLAKEPWERALPAAILLGQGSEFSFVVVGAALAAEIMPGPIGQFMLLVSALSMFMTPLYILLAEKLEKKLAKGKDK